MTVATLDIPADTQRKQRRAADPDHSAWVSANAGSGKTFVLTRRVVRLLLRGVEPNRILCLTFTKAAAANMAIRVFETLAEWVTLDDASLARSIAETGAPPPGPDDLAAARRLFARTVETPGGLKILTIHAFCEKVLHQFPFEANVAAGFTVIEDRRQEDLLSRARETVLAGAAAMPETEVARALEVLSCDISAADFAALVRDAAKHRAALADVLREAGGMAALAEALGDALGTRGRDVAAIEHAMLHEGLPPSEWDAIGRHLQWAAGRGSTAVGDSLLAAAAAPDEARLDAYLNVFLTQKLEPRSSSYLAKTLRTAEPALCARLDREQERLVTLLAERRAAAALARTMALLVVAGAVLDRYETLKRRAGLLDFADLIERTRLLVTRSDSAWILYKLDAGIDHLLVDEAQDTSPDQWAILQAITRDVFAGAGAREAGRTVFAVGDEKQSIYSFQGARPESVEAVRRDFARRAGDARVPFDSIALLLSFRSARTVLDVVDRIFAHADNARGLSAAQDGPPTHQALKTTLPGLVEIWPVVAPVPLAEPADWQLPLDAREPSDPAVVLAGRIASRIAAMIGLGSRETVAADQTGARRPVRPGDILILVRSRNAIFDAVIRALKTRGVPVAGADRLILTDHIATMDLVAAGRAALLPDDDLTLACLLKSPLIGLDDDDLIDLAPGRAGSLEAALRASPADRHRRAAGRLAIWRDRAATLTPFAFYTRLLGQDGGRKALLSRLGPEAADVIDEFVALTLAHERDGAPSLLAFLARIETTSLTIKRDLQAAGDAVRVMTVHAAKGLEAKIVFLPDTCDAPNGRQDARLFRLDDGGALPLLAWSPKAGTDTAAIAARRDGEHRAALDEHRRLLYVALTRAEERLYIAGFRGRNPAPATCWYDMIVAADLGDRVNVPAHWDARDTVVRYGAVVDTTAAADASSPAAVPPALPAWIGRPALREEPLAPPVRPSSALGAADRPDRVDDTDAPALGGRRTAILSGRLVHRLLEYLPPLPPEQREAAARRFLARYGGQLAAEAQVMLVDSVMGVIAAPALAPLFAQGSRAEVAIAATITRAGRDPLPVTGQIDRMTVTADAVLIAEYKSGLPRPLAETPPRYLAQLALYAAAVAPLYPTRRIDAFLIWTVNATVVPVDAATLDAALQSVDAGA